MQVSTKLLTDDFEAVIFEVVVSECERRAPTINRKISIREGECADVSIEKTNTKVSFSGRWQVRITVVRKISPKDNRKRDGATS